MRKRTTTILVLAIGILGIAFPMLAALYLAHRQSMDEEIRLAMTMTDEVLRRANAAGDQAIAGHARLMKADAADPCSEPMLALMRDIGMASSYLKTFGHVANNRLLCSSLGRHGDGIPLGPVEFTSAQGSAFRTSVDLGLGEGRRFLVVEKDGYAAAINPESLVDIFVDRQDLSLGIFSNSGERRLSSRGFFDAKWMTRLQNAQSAIFFDGSYLVTMKRSNSYDTAAYVAVPKDYLSSRLFAFARVLVPIGLVLGAAVSWGILRLARQRTSLASELRTALKRRQLVLHYQPVIELDSQRIVGVEALLRWPSRGGPGLRPDLFIPIAEECGLIQQVTEYVLRSVAADIPRLLAKHPDCYVSINLASSDLHSETIVDSLRKLLQTQGIQPGNILVEATEHSFLDAQIAKRIVTQIRTLGIRVAIDDFGTGFSSLSHLTTLQTDFLKIDKVFVESVGTDSATSEVALHIIRIAESLGLKVIGEGVETEVQATFLRAHGVQYAQGWLYHAAMPMEQLLELLEGQLPPADPQARRKPA